MKSFLKYVSVLLLMLVLATPALAQRRSGSPYGGGGSEGRSAISGALGFYGPGDGSVYNSTNGLTQMGLSGLFGLGADYDYFIGEDISVGGLFRYYSTSDSFSGSDATDTLMTLGGTVRAHLIETTNWSGNVSSGLGIVNPTAKRGNTTIDPGMNFGFYLGMTLLYKLNPDMHLGIENLRAFGLGDKINGWLLSDYMVKLRFFM